MSEVISPAAIRRNETMNTQENVNRENVDEASAGMDIVTEAESVVVELKIYGH